MRPKPMIDVGGRPALWQIMKIYLAHRTADLIVCCGYTEDITKGYSANYCRHMSDLTLNIGANTMTVDQRRAEPWSVTLIDTGDDPQMGGQLKPVADHIRDEELSQFTYGDGVGDISASIAFGRAHGKAATLTATHPSGRFGAHQIGEQRVELFLEEPQVAGA